MCLEQFVRYSNNNNLLEGRMFIKLCKESKLIDSELTSVICDIAYAQKVKRGQKFLDYEGFIKVIEEIAFIKGIPFETVVEKIKSSNGPLYTSKISAKPNRLYDEKKIYSDRAQSRGIERLEERLLDTL